LKIAVILCGFLALLVFLGYTYLMVIEQTVEIPENHRLIFNLPMQIPTGKAKAALTLTFEGASPENRLPVEPFAAEREAIDFANYYAGRILHEAG
jgi:hypothetical protein